MGLYPRKIGFVEVLKEKRHSPLELQHNVPPIPPLGHHSPNCDSPQEVNENPGKKRGSRGYSLGLTPPIGRVGVPPPNCPRV
jgi:hypothetical protein